MSRLQAGIGSVVVALALAPAAYACDEPSSSGDRERVEGEAGSKVDLELPNTLEGARWELRIEDGEELADGVDEDAEERGVTVRFEVPDLGEDARTVDLVAEVTHEADGADWSYEVELAYAGRSRPDSEPEVAQEPAREEQPAPPPESPREEPPSQQPAPAPAPAPQPEVAASAAGPAAIAPAEAGPPLPTPDARPMLRAGTAPAPGPAPPPAPAIVGLGTPVTPAPAAPAAPGTRPGSAARPRHVVPRPAAAPPAEPRQPPPPERPEGGIRLPDVDLPGFGAGLAWTLIVAGGLSFAAAGLALAGIARQRRRRGIA